MMAYFHCCGTSPPIQIQTMISSSLRRRAGSPLRMILSSSTETPSGPTAFPFANERMAPVSSSASGDMQVVDQTIGLLSHVTESSSPMVWPITNKIYVLASLASFPGSDDNLPSPLTGSLDKQYTRRGRY